MQSLTTDQTRRIIDDFAKEISRRKEPGEKPKKEVIYFRQDHIKRKERVVWLVPTELLRFRKDNGRIASEVASYEKRNAPLLEESEDAQEVLRKFLNDKDPEKTTELMNSISHSGQREPAIITCDGFLINGNRRKLALEKLFEKTKNDKFKWMRVVILPGENDLGGPPTLLEIEQIENRYQLQKEGKAEYYNFDRALSMRRKIALGMSLEQILKDDPNYAELPAREFKKEVAKVQKEYLDPLNCVDKYLEDIGSEGMYNLISQGMSDKEGRWQAFLDYSHYVEKKLLNEKQRLEIGLSEDEVGIARDVAFKIIRQRTFPSLPKLHSIMRNYTKYLSDEDAKKELFALKNIDLESPNTSESASQSDRDKAWSEKNANSIIRQVKKAIHTVEYKHEKEEPVALLENVLERLQQDTLNPETISITDLPVVRKLAEEIRDTADDLKSRCWQNEKNSDPGEIKKKLKQKYKVK